MTSYLDIFKKEEKKQPVLTKEITVKPPEISLDLEEHSINNSTTSLTCARIILDYIGEKIPDLEYESQNPEQELAYLVVRALHPDKLSQQHLDKRIEEMGVDKGELTKPLKNGVTEAINNYINKTQEEKIKLATNELSLLLSIITEKMVTSHSTTSLEDIRSVLKRIKKSKPGLITHRRVRKDDVIGMIHLKEDKCYIVKGVKGEEIILYDPEVDNTISKEYNDGDCFKNFKISTDRLGKKGMLKKLREEITSGKLGIKPRTDNIAQIIESLSKAESMKTQKEQIKKARTKPAPISNKLQKKIIKDLEPPSSYKKVFNTAFNNDIKMMISLMQNKEFKRELIDEVEHDKEVIRNLIYNQIPAPIVEEQFELVKELFSKLAMRLYNDLKKKE